MKSPISRIEALEREVKPGDPLVDLTPIIKTIYEFYDLEYDGPRFLAPPSLLDELAEKLKKVYDHERATEPGLGE